MNKQAYFDDKIYLSPKNWDEDLNSFDSIYFDRMKTRTFNAIKNLYSLHDFTAREICDLYDVPFQSQYNKLFYTIFGQKGKAHGGKRKGSGQKKK